MPGVPNFRDQGIERRVDMGQLPKSLWDCLRAAMGLGTATSVSLPSPAYSYHEPPGICCLPKWSVCPSTACLRVVLAHGGWPRWRPGQGTGRRGMLAQLRAFLFQSHVMFLTVSHWSAPSLPDAGSFPPPSEASLLPTCPGRASRGPRWFR